MIKEETGAVLAILTNSSLLYMEDVKQDLEYFDIVSLKIDTVIVDTWRRLNRPHPELELDRILDSIIDFSKNYTGKLIIETMIVRDINDKLHEYEELARFLSHVDFSKLYITVPIRPPAEKWVHKPSEEKILEAYKTLSNYLGIDRIELLISPEGSNFRFGDNIVEDIVRTIYVHPLKISVLKNIADERGLEFDKLISDLKKRGVIVIEYNGEEFLVPKIRR